MAGEVARLRREVGPLRGEVGPLARRTFSLWDYAIMGKSHYGIMGLAAIHFHNLIIPQSHNSIISQFPQRGCHPSIIHPSNRATGQLGI
jgi:hypothetical protein